ncbi:MAG TPA: nucleotidyltransferase domain-containing protein [Anaerolineales bacterium]|nr:nucleotidyltransferase domain-containing protein [Anaerolineales bacterium]
MPRILNFDPYFATSLPETYTLLMSSNLTVHPSVSRLILHGSRGLAGGFRPDSDLDLSLIVDTAVRSNVESLLQNVLETTFHHWRSPIEPDLAVIFDIKNCKLKCFDRSTWNEQICQLGGIDCFGLYKTQKGFKGLVTDAGIQVRLMYPCLRIWRRV